MAHNNKKLTITIKFENITKTRRLTHHDIKWNVKENTKGIYVIFDDNNIIYVGKSNDIHERLMSHVSDSEQNLELRSRVMGGNVYFQIIEEEDEIEQCRLENILYDYFFHPICNHVRPEKYDN